MIHVLVDLLGLTVLAEQAPQNTHPPHPQNLGGKPSLPGTPALAYKDIGLVQVYCLPIVENCNINELQQHTISRVPSLLLGLMCPSCTGS
jgi:hypothetical protein